MSEEIQSLRQQINEVDEQLAELFDRRMTISKGVALYKKEHNLPIFDKEREQQVLARVVEAYPNRDQAFHKSLVTFFQTVMDLSKESQKQWITDQVAIGYYGVPGSFSNEALECFFGTDGVYKSYRTFEEEFQALAEGEIRYGVFPIENSTTGIISEVYDLLAAYDFYIVREGSLRIEQNLLGLPGATLEEITEVYSHAQGFAQSAEFFSGHPNWTLIPFYSTAKSAERVAKEQDPRKACVAGKKAAKLHGLEILQAGIQDNSQNFTRFVVISPNMEVPTGANKISLYFTLEHKPGSLFAALEEISKRGLNMLKIESRPIKGQIWEYSFFVDLEGNVDDPSVADALRMARQHCIDWKILGNYALKPAGSLSSQ